MPHSSDSIYQQAEKIVANMPSLLAKAIKVANTTNYGLHGRRRPGPGEDFWQFRRYESNDPASSIDWRRTAASQHTYIREHEWQIAQTVLVWKDNSKSMNFISSLAKDSKKDRANILILALSFILLKGGETIGLIGNNIRQINNKSALEKMAETLLFSDNNKAFPYKEPIKKNAHIIIFSDFLDPLNNIEKMVKNIAKDNSNGHLVQILDPAEKLLPFKGRIVFNNPENEFSTMIGKVESVRNIYKNRIKDHYEGLKNIASLNGWTLTQHVTDNSPESALISIYNGINRF